MKLIPNLIKSATLVQFILAASEYEKNYSLFNGLAKEGNLDEMKKVLENFDGAENDKSVQNNYINQGDHWKKTTIHYAAEHGHADIIKMLNKDYKGDVSAKDYRGRTALHIAAQKGNSNAIKELLSINSDLIHIVDNDNKNALHYAAETGQYSVVKSLVGRADNSAENNSKFLDINK
jgi:ankyrin repeat protein